MTAYSFPYFQNCAPFFQRNALRHAALVGASLAALLSAQNAHAADADSTDRLTASR
jgi:hypothetical protein